MSADEERPVEPLETWFKTKPYWERLLWKLASQCDQLSADQITQCYDQLCVAVGLRAADEGELPDIAFDTIYDAKASPTEVKPKIRIQEITDIRRVNALANDCVLSCGPHLTLVYGRNGSGKSGLARLLANACFSRGKRDVLPNLRSNSATSAKAGAKFVIGDVKGGPPNSIDYELDAYHADLKRFAVFDEQSVHIHLDESNKVTFVPPSIAIFDKVAAAIAQLEHHVAQERATRRRANPFSLLFADPNEQSDVATFCRGINEGTPDARLEEVIAFNDDVDNAEIATLENTISDKRSLNVPAQKAQLADDKSSLDIFHRTLKEWIGPLTASKAQQINEAIASLHEQEQVVKRLGVSSLDDGVLASIGSPEWMALLRAAKSLYEAERKLLERDPQNCMLCHQPLQEREQELFQKYWRFLEDDAEAELVRIEQGLRTTLVNLREAKLNRPRFAETDHAVRVLTAADLGHLEELKAKVSSLDNVLDSWIAALDTKSALASTEVAEADLSCIADLSNQLAERRKNLADPTSEIMDLERQLLSLKHRRKALPLRSEALDYLAYRRWLAKIDKVSFAGIKAATTKKRTETFLVGVGTEYKALFNRELATLGCDFNLVLHTSGEQGRTVKEYRLEFAEDYSPTQVLSEGEQNACSLADFLAEVQIDTANCGIVLDDPVSSLDHERKELIAKRLVEEARHRQVLIFTHDIAFMRKLVDSARNESVPLESHWIRKIAGTPGHIALHSSPKLASAAALKADAIAAVKDYTSMEAKKQEEAVGIALDYLRSACEALVEEYLFAKSIQRYDDHIRIQNLEETVFDQPLTQRVVDLHGELSALILAHNLSDEMREDAVDIDDFTSVLSKFNSVEADLKSARSAAKRARERRNESEKTARGGW